jgi:hypothetical protein
MATPNTVDPIQGFDVEVTVNQGGSDILVGRFTSILVRVVNVTETYLELNQRMPRHLDGEINIVWQMERGMLNMEVLEQTFGFFMPQGPGAALSINRKKNPPRAHRFSVVFAVNSSLSESFNDTELGAMWGQGKSKRYSYSLNLCKVDTMSFGATSGRNIVANQWQGTAEEIDII